MRMSRRRTQSSRGAPAFLVLGALVVAIGAGLLAATFTLIGTLMVVAAGLVAVSVLILRRALGVASDATLALAAAAVSVGGEISYIGRAGGSLAVNPGRLPFECSVRLPSWGTLPELAEVVELARAGAIHVEVERLALEETVEAYRRLRRGEIRGRAVVVPSRVN